MQCNVILFQGNAQLYVDNAPQTKISLTIWGHPQNSTILLVRQIHIYILSQLLQLCQLFICLSQDPLHYLSNLYMGATFIFEPLVCFIYLFIMTACIFEQFSQPSQLSQLTSFIID